jgi:hypothetical protein
MNDGQTANPCQQYQDSMSTMAGTLTDGFKSKMNDIVSKYKPVFDQIQDDSPNPGAVGATLNIDFDVTWSDVSIKFDLPEVTMTLQRWSFDVPQVTMKQQEIIFHTPSTRMGTQKVGQWLHGRLERYPDRCAGIFYARAKNRYGDSRISHGYDKH